MSGTVARNNVVPMPANGTPPTTPVPWPQPGMWPMPSAMAGCCPPSNLMQCYCDIQNATAFICAVMVDCINTNPAVTTAIIDAITKSGSNVPLLGVTNGADAQPGQVGEWVIMSQNVSYTTGNQTQTVSMGILQAGDWDCWVSLNPEMAVTAVQFYQNPLPPGFIGGLPGWFFSTDSQNALVISPVNRALISVASPVIMTLITTAPGAGTANMIFYARRMR